VAKHTKNIFHSLTIINNYHQNYFYISKKKYFLCALPLVFSMPVDDFFLVKISKIIFNTNTNAIKMECMSVCVFDS